MPDNEFEYSVQEAAAFVGVNPETIRRNIKAGNLSATKAWLSYKIKASELARFRDWYEQQVYANRKRGEE